MSQELVKLGEQFNAVVVDGASGSTEIQQATLQVAHLGLIPAQPSILDLAATDQTLQTIRQTQGQRQSELKAFTFLVRVTPKSVLLEEAQEVLQSYPDIPLLSVKIPQRQVIADAMGQNKTLFDYQGDRNAKAMGRCYEKLFQEAGL
ncbi:MAG: ParA family protein [Oscillatoriales cyanobacterium SM2_3_0]|nr:ParA family protein [Oscillatoriales cyanobacterium SM2_3_0]